MTIKTILVPASGTATDHAVFETAHAVARSLRAHLDFYHLRIPPGEASPYVPHVDYAIGPALRNALDYLRDQTAERALMAARHVGDFCATRNIRIAGNPTGLSTISASWTEETGDAPRRLMTRARHSDLIVVGRSQGPDGLPRYFLETLLLGCGRPLLIAVATPPTRPIGTVVVGWKETAEAARALASALPILARADQVILVSVEEEEAVAPGALDDLRRALEWHGVNPMIRSISAAGPIAEVLAATAAHERADLLVMGAYGHGRMREVIFGGCTQAFLEQADLPVFMLH